MVTKPHHRHVVELSGTGRLRKVYSASSKLDGGSAAFSLAGARARRLAKRHGAEIVKCGPGEYDVIYSGRVVRYRTRGCLTERCRPITQ